MSATFHLYKVVDGVDFLGSKYDISTKEEREKRELILRTESENLLDDDFYETKYSDGKKHEYFDLTYYKALSRQWKPNTLSKQIRPLFDLPFTRIHTTWGWDYKAIVVDEILYRQGWFLTKKWFNKNLTLFITTDKEKMIKFLKNNLDFSYRYRGDEKYYPAYECLDAFSNAFEDGMIFECSF
ncbi:hypothetical protein [Thomasclavelia cocleata]|jgi:hypothetical protein|uniref:hypothetical protein n=1 Tax=Thomasclavelia cocleata TaxID=69824 RepID=UPI00256EA6E8|nr:hypothetical protein [Thomasclavelia cocleata]